MYIKSNYNTSFQIGLIPKLLLNFQKINAVWTFNTAIYHKNITLSWKSALPQVV